MAMLPMLSQMGGLEGGASPFASPGGGSPFGAPGGGMPPPDMAAMSEVMRAMFPGGGLGAMPPPGMGMSPGATPAAPAVPPEQLYATQLQQLRDMGFYSAAENIRALQITRGNVEAAVEWLLSHPPGAGL